MRWSVRRAGLMSAAVLLCVGVLPAGAGGDTGTAQSITRHGITWEFAEAVEFGRYANGDYWVLGPVDVVSINPPTATDGGRTVHGCGS